MPSLEHLTQAVAAETSLERALETLLESLAHRIKATSNDQNIQALAREVKAATPGLVAALARERAPQL